MKPILAYLIFAFVWFHSLPVWAASQQHSAVPLSNPLPVGLNEKMGLAVLELEANAADPALAKALGDLIRLQLFELPGIRVIERVRMTDILKEQNFQLSAHCGDSYTCLKEAGRILGVNRLVIGSVHRVGQIHSIHLRLVDVQTAELAGTALVQCQCGPEEILTRMSLQLSHKLAEAIYQRLPMGSLTLESTPPGAEVVLNDQVLGQTPLSLPRVLVGEKELLLRKKNFLPLRQVVKISPADHQLQRYVLKGGEEVGYLSVQTHPAGAKIQLDGQIHGPTPLRQLAIPVGLHQMEIQLPGYKPQILPIMIEKGQEHPIQVVLPPLQPAQGALLVSGAHRGAQVRLNGKPVGKTPLRLSLAPGNYDLEVSHYGFSDWQEQIQVQSETQTTVEPELVREEPHWGIMLGVFSGILLILTSALFQRGAGQMQRADMVITGY